MKITRTRSWMPKHSVSLGNWKSSVTLEWEFWNEFRKIAKRLKLTQARLALEIDGRRGPYENLSSAIRVYVLKDVMARSRESVQRLDQFREIIKAYDGGTTKDGLAPMSAVIAGGRANA